MRSHSAMSIPWRTSLLVALVTFSWIGRLAETVPISSADEPIDVTDQFVLPEGMQATVWAKSPMLHNPTNIDVDARGRVWVAEAVNYRNFANHQKDRAEVLYHSRGDRIMILEDTNGDGAADMSKVFVEDADLVAPLGVAVLGNRVIVSCSPHLLVFTDTDGDDKSDTKERLLTGFGGFDHDHGLHALVIGPDGRWYFNTGNAGPHVVTDRAGWTLRSGTCYTGGSPHNATNQAGLISDDHRTWVGGLAMRIEPDGKGLCVLGHNFRNAYELCVDSLGNVWQNDNDDTISCRTTWLMESGNTGYFSTDGSRMWGADRRPGQSTQTAHWRQEDPGVIPVGDIYGPGAPTGIVFYEDGALGASYRGMLLSCESGRNVVWGYLPKPDGAGFTLERFPFFSSVDEDDPEYVWHKLESDRRKWFRPSDVAVGPDGAIYVADWFDQVVGGHKMNDPQGTGTIYRIAPKGSDLRVPKLDLTSIPGQIKALRSPAVHVRALAYESLRRQDDAANPAILALLEDDNLYVRGRAIWLLAQRGDAGRAAVEALLKNENPRLRLTAFRALRQLDPDAPIRYAELARDPSPAVRRELALALRDVPLDSCRLSLLELATGYDGDDRWYLEAIGTATDGKEEAIYPDLHARLGSKPLDWSPRFAGLVWRLHPVAAIEALKERAASDQLSVVTRKQALDSLAFTPHDDAANAMVDLANEGPSDLRSYAAWWVRHRHNNDWRAFDVVGRLDGNQPSFGAGYLGPLPPNEPAFVSAVIREGGIQTEIDITGANTLWLVVDDAGDGFSCDWADWATPRLIGSEGETRLTELKWIHANTGYGKIHKNKNCRGLPLRIGGRRVAWGVGTHANSTLVYDLRGKGFTRFQFGAGVDNGGVTLGGSDYPTKASSVKFLVYHDGHSPRELAAERRDQILDSAVNLDRKREIVAQMAESGPGGMMLVHMTSEGKLPEPLRETVETHIFRCPDVVVRSLASEHYRRPGSDSNVLPPIKALLALSGDSTRGRELFLGEKAACSNCHTFDELGQAGGPDLTEIGRKFDRAGLLDSILNPSAAILLGYETWIVVTDSGKIYTGFLAADGEVVVLTDNTGKQHAIDRAEIEERQQQKLSIMPDVAVAGLTSQDLADLLEFLSTPSRDASR